MEDDRVSRWPGYTGQCNPEVWNRSAKPPQPNEKKIGQLTEQQVNQYFDQGVVLVDNYFSPSELDPIKRDINRLVDILANHLYDEEKITNKYEEYGFYERLTMLNKDFPGANLMLIKIGIMPRSISKLWSGDKLCNAVEQLIGPDIGGHPVWNLRTKTPQDEATTVPWHQDVLSSAAGLGVMAMCLGQGSPDDCAYLDPSSYSVHQPTAWIPLLDANATNGCMEFAVGGHRSGKIAMHQCCEGDTHYVMLEPEQMSSGLGVDLQQDLKVFPMNYGSVLFFNNCIPHRSLNNVSGDPGVIRWSLDLRWQDPRKPWGFHGLKNGIVFRKSNDRSWRPPQEDWDQFLKHRQLTSTADGLDIEHVKKSFTFDTTLGGPWMNNWEITHGNRHVESYAHSRAFSWHS